MGFIKRLLAKIRGESYEDFEEELWEEEEPARQIDYNNKEQRNDYVRNCLEKMGDATKELRLKHCRRRRVSS